MSAKYPRTKHFPFSPGSTSDDKFMSEEDYESLIGEHLVFTEKLDGSNVCLTRDAVYSRSHSGPPGHVSFNPLKSLHSVLRHTIDNDVSVFGEWCYAVHSIEYSVLQHHLNIFGVRDDTTGRWWDWDYVELMAAELSVPTVPVLLEGAVGDKKKLQKIIESFASLSSVYGPVREGLVVRKYYDVYQDNEKLMGLGKWVRANHVQTDEHWTRKPVDKQPSILTLQDF
jgi:hypothetical protein